MHILVEARRRWFLCFLAVLLAVSRLGMVSASESSPPSQLAVKTERPASWAVPLTREGLPNLFKVSDNLYRGAQPPAPEGFKELKKMGVRTVVNLRAFHDDSDKMKGTGLGYERMEFKTWHPENEDIVKFLKIVTDTNKTPVFVHCQHGADRTGTMCAVFRIAVQGWGREEAIKEMTQGSFGFHEVWDNLITYIRGLDVNKIRKEAGLNRPIPSPQSSPKRGEEGNKMER